MMISTRGRYALRILVDLAENQNDDGYITLKEAAERQEVSEKYGMKTCAIVTMKEVVEHLWNNPYNGKIIIDDELKGRIDDYYSQYGIGGKL